MTTERHTTKRHKRREAPDAKRRGRVTLGAGLFCFGLLSVLLAGALGGPASPDKGDAAMILLGLATFTGLGGLAMIMWGLVASTE